MLAFRNHASSPLGTQRARAAQSSPIKTFTSPAAVRPTTSVQQQTTRITRLAAAAAVRGLSSEQGESGPAPHIAVHDAAGVGLSPHQGSGTASPQFAILVAEDSDDESSTTHLGGYQGPAGHPRQGQTTGSFPRTDQDKDQEARQARWRHNEAI